ncbi:MAG: hypothetical protein KAH23_00550 [Kiritimatiellae bacterium]|nr:hypothetical protein [Kiritimatiellia bacterium]
MLKWLDKITQREKVMLSLAVLFLIAVFVNFVAIQPTWKHMNDMDSLIEKDTELRNVNRSKLQDESLVMEEYRIVCDLISKSSSSSVAIENMKEKIGNLAVRTKVVVGSMSHSDPVQTEFYEEYSVEIGKFQAKMPDLLGFLHELSVAGGMLRVMKINIQPKKHSDIVEGRMVITKKVAMTE